MDASFKSLTIFVAVVEAGSFTLAAERLHLSRSAVGKAIARLEAHLATRLFHRTTRQQSLTEAGSLFYEHCLRALAELRAAQSLLAADQSTVTGRLRVSMPVLFGRLCVAPILLSLAQAHPQLILSLSFNDRIVDLHEDGFDLVIRHGGLAHSDHLAARKLIDYDMILCAAPAYLAKAGTPTQRADLVHHQAIVYQRSPHGQSWFPNLDAFLPPRLFFDDVQAIADAAIAGMGLANLPCWLIKDALAAGQLQPVPMAEPNPQLSFYAQWPPTPYLPLKTRAAIDILQAQLPAQLRQA
ncbi:MAG: LysR family transcriptional regulator [Neisseriaceae bacterium]|nr:LysR family transcriptional regulator [Neisseriaceae bacterium]